MKNVLSPCTLARATQVILIISFISMLLFFSGNALPAAAAPPPVLSDEILASPDTLRSFLENLYQHTLDRGVKNFYSFSYVLINECTTALKQNDYAKALLLSEYAEKLSPDLPAATRAAARAEWENNKLLVFHLLYGYARALTKQIRDLESASHMLATTLLAILAAFCLTMLIFCAISMINYFPLAVHDIKHLFLKAASQTSAAGWTALVFLLPLFFNLSIFWTAALWLLLLSGYQTRSERIITIGIFILWLLLPLMIFTTSAALYAPHSDTIKILWRANYGSWDSTDSELLKRLSIDNQQDIEILFTLGLMNKKDQAYASAEAYYTQLLSIKPGYYRAHVNLGNVFFATKRLDSAIEEYNTAIAINPSQASAHFNLSRAYLQKFMFKESETAFVKANTLDSAAVSHYFKIYSENPNRFLIDESLSRGELWEKALQVTSFTSGLADQLWDLLFRGVSRTYAGIIAVFLLAGAVLSAADTRFRIAVSCKCCGTVTCRRCRHINVQSDYCPQCVIVFGKKEGVNPLLKEHKFFDIKKHIWNTLKIIKCFSWAAPGSGYIWKGHPVRGIILAFLLLFVLFKIIFSAAFSEGSAHLINAPSVIGNATAVVLLLIVWLGIVRSSVWLKDERETILSQLAAVQKSFAKSDTQTIPHQ